MREIRDQAREIAKSIANDAAAFAEANPGIMAGARGTAMGFGVGTTAAIVKDVLDMLEDRKKAKKRKHPTVSSDTIIINVPKRKEVRGEAKKASARDSMLACSNKKECDESNEHKWKQARNADGTFTHGWEYTIPSVNDKKTEKKAAGASNNDPPPRESYRSGYFEGGTDKALAFALGVLGTALGFTESQKLHAYLKKKRLQREIAAAQREYVDFLTGKTDTGDTVKMSASLDGVKPLMQNSLLGRVWNFGSNLVPNPTSQQDLAEFGQNAIGFTGGLALLVMTASTLLTKRYLDKKFEEADSAKTVPNTPKVNNIVFKTVEAEAKDVEMDAVDALAFVKFASIVMKKSQTSYGVLEKNAALGFGGFGDVVVKGVTSLVPEGAKEWASDKLQDVAVSVAPEMAGEYAGKNKDTYEIIDKIFENIGYGGNDPTKWKYNPDRPDLSDNERKMYGKMYEEIQKRNPAFLTAFMNDRYKDKREALAGAAAEDWFGSLEKKNPWLSKVSSPLKWLLRLLSGAVAKTSFGQKRMWDKVMSGIKDMGPQYGVAPQPPPSTAAQNDTGK